MSDRKAIVLLSGGIDSTAMLYHAMVLGFKVHALIIDYGQKNRIEIDKAKIVASIARIPYKVVKVELSGILNDGITNKEVPLEVNRSLDDIEGTQSSTYVPARNLLFLSLALGYAESIEAYDIFIGIYSRGIAFPDATPSFCRAFEKVAQKATFAGRNGKTFKIHSHRKADKHSVVKHCVDSGIDLSDTISCLAPVNGLPCGVCDSCVVRANVFRELGFDDPAMLEVKRAKQGSDRGSVQ